MSNVNIADDIEKRHRLIKAGFVAQGSTLSEWSRANGVNPQNAHRALRGQWQGPKANALVAAILEAAKVTRAAGIEEP